MKLPITTFQLVALLRKNSGDFLKDRLETPFLIQTLSLLQDDSD